jgi:MSHA biogenesis protein MshM
MYLAHFGFSEPPFRITPHTDFFFSGANRGATLEALLYAILHDEGIVKVSGEVGSGKTMLCRVLMDRLPDTVETIYLANPSVSRDEILIAIADELKIELEPARATRLMRSLQDALIRLYGEGRRVVVLIDEAHAMPKETLEEIRLLSNLEANRNKLLQIVLFGQPELDAHLNTADMRQLKERITHSFRLEPLVRSDIASYIEFRLRAAGYRGPNPFSAGAVRMIAEASEGLTRRINILADKALLAAFAENSHAVTEREVKRAVNDSEFYEPERRYGRLGFGASAAALGLAAGIAVGWAAFDAGERGPAAIASLPAPQQAHREAAALPAERRAQQSPAPRPRAAETAQVTPVQVQLGKPVVEGEVATPPKPKLVQQRFAATQEWLKKAPDGHYAIQLLTVKETDVGRLESFLRKAAAEVPDQDIHVYSVKIDGAQHYRAAYGSYPDVTSVRAAMKELPALLKAQNPYHRSIERMRSQNRQ